MSKAIVTGGAGFIGSHIVDALIASGYQVTVIDDLSSGTKEFLPENVTLHVEDIRSERAKEIVKEVAPDLLVHAAAQISVRISMEDPYLDTHVNVAGFVNLLSACRDGLSPHVVFLSTGGAIYGEQEKFPADESHPVTPTSVYGLAKRVGELYLDFWKRSFGLTFTALRLSNVYGPRQNPHGEAGVVAIFSKTLLRGDTPFINGDGKQTRDFVFVKDVARAVEIVSEKRVEGIFNIGTGLETNVNELYNLIASALNTDTAPVHREAMPGEQMRSSVDATLASRTFSWQPEVSISEGIKLTTEWFKSQT